MARTELPAKPALELAPKAPVKLSRATVIVGSGKPNVYGSLKPAAVKLGKR